MTRERAKEFLPIIQAFVEGKTIQFMSNRGWEDVPSPAFYHLTKYRIKPEPRVWKGDVVESGRDYERNFSEFTIRIHDPHHELPECGPLRVREITD